MFTTTRAVLAAALTALLAFAPDVASAAPGHQASAQPSGLAAQLRGVNRSGTEFMCVQNRGIFDGPSDAASVQAIRSWHTTVVRVPLNEDCWLGINGVNGAYAGANYRSAIANYVSLLRRNGESVIVEMHWSDGTYTGAGSTCSTYGANCQKPMPDSAHAPDFWRSVAGQFRSDSGVIFDLFNEPFPNSVISNYTQAWKCWRDGGSACPGFPYAVAGMAALVQAVRSAGARNFVMVGGLSYANDLSQWLAYRPADPAGNIGASWHSYNFNYCVSSGCWDSQIAPVAAKVPLVVGEIGENDCGHGYIDSLIGWLDRKSISYLGWTWNTWDCRSGPSLITDYNGTPTAYGAGLRAHLAG